jgi:hypothetical protein
MSDDDRNLQERLLAWAIRDDQVAERANRQAGRESYDSILRRERLLADWLRAVLRRSAALLLLCALCWPALTASAPVPAQACDVAANGVQIRRRIEVERNGVTVPIGQIETSWSCSTAEAEAKAAELEAQVRARAQVDSR